MHSKAYPYSMEDLAWDSVHSANLSPDETKPPGTEDLLKEINSLHRRLRKLEDRVRGIEGYISGLEPTNYGGTSDD